MNFYEMMCLAKLFSVALYGGRVSLTPTELDVAAEVLKKLTKNRDDWNQSQKDAYKLLVDYVKDKSTKWH